MMINQYRVNYKTSMRSVLEMCGKSKLWVDNYILSVSCEMIHIKAHFCFLNIINFKLPGHIEFSNQCHRESSVVPPMPLTA